MNKTKNAIALLLLLAFVAFAQGPPKEAGTFREPELREIVKLDPTIKLDIRYATRNNFLGRPVYKESRAFLQKPAAEALVRAHQRLRPQGYGIVVFDGYRPWAVTKIFWDVTPQMYELSTGKIVQMPSEYDEMTERAHINYACATPEAKRLREMLRSAMEAEGFAVYEPEWWHYDYKDWKEYPILNVPFSKIR
jgi:zinc D-Ala-D-Ala dipeptidase